MKLTDRNSGKPKRGSVLTNVNKPKFKMSLERSLESGFCFKNLQIREIKKFNDFINKTVGRNLTVQEVNDLYGRDVDKTDIVDGNTVYHYKVSDKFRIHGYLNDGYFVICRIDPNHRVH